MTLRVPVSMPSTPPQPLRGGVASLPQCKGREKLSERHHCCVPAALRNAFSICIPSPGKRLVQFSEEERKSGDQQLRTAGRYGVPKRLLQKRGGDGHLGCIGKQVGRLRVDKVPAALLRDTGII